MENYKQLIIKAAQSTDPLTDDEVMTLRRISHDYPASALAPALLLSRADSRLSAEERTALQTRVALTGGDRAALINLIDPSGMQFAHFYPAEPAVKKPTTENAIDTFLEAYGHQSPEEDALLERMIFNPVPDYAEQLARDEASSPHPQQPADSQDALIDAFLASNPVAKPASEGVESETVPVEISSSKTSSSVKPEMSAQPEHRKELAPSQSSSLSESLAKIFIKQGRYDRAYEIISNLNLNYPEKSVYFADQLRFLKKLMINQQHLAKQTT